MILNNVWLIGNISLLHFIRYISFRIVSSKIPLVVLVLIFYYAVYVVIFCGTTMDLLNKVHGTTKDFYLILIIMKNIKMYYIRCLRGGVYSGVCDR
jgi:hypothetical protein